MTAYRNALDRFQEYKDDGFLETALDEYRNAAECGHYNIARAFFKIFGDEYVDSVEKGLVMTPFQKALSRNHYHTAQLLVDHGANVDFIFSFDKKSYLIERCDMFINRRRDEKAVIFLVENGADVHLKDKNGKSAYSMMVEYKQDDLIAFFDDPHAPRAPFEIEIKEALDACRDGRRSTVKSFVKKFGVTPLQEGKGDNQNGLLRAVKNRHTNVMKYLLEQGADVNAKDGEGNPISKLCMKSLYPLEIILENENLDLNAVDADGNTLLMKTVLGNRPESLKKVLAKTPRLDIKNNAGQRFRHLADLVEAGQLSHAEMATILKPYTTRAAKEKICAYIDQGVAENSVRVKRLRLNKPKGLKK